MDQLKNESQTEIIQKQKKQFTIGKFKFTVSQIKWWFFFSLVVISLIALIAAIIYTEIYVRRFKLRVDCNPDLPLNYDECQKRGCLWVQRSSELQPPCFFPDGYGYRSTESKDTPYGHHLNLIREPKNSVFGDEIDNLNLMVFKETKTRLRMKFVDTEKKRYEVPLDVPSPPTTSPDTVDYGVAFENDPQFGVEVKRLSTGTVIFDTNVPGMIFSDQYLQITTRLPSANIYGLGEHLNYDYRHSTNWLKLSFFARDITPYTTGLNCYSSHPFYMVVEEDGNAHGVFLLNSNGLEVVIQPFPALTFRALGGILDFYVFMGPTPEDVVKQYMEVIGLPMMPPYWSLGFHLSRYGYNTTDEMEVVTKRMIENEIPYDVQHFDIDYMDSYLDFTVNPKGFKDLDKFVKMLHTNHDIKVVMIVDPGISSNKTLIGKYPPLDIGLSRDIFIKLNNEPIEGEVWPGKCYYPDFSNPNAKIYWTQLCTEFHKKIPFDGLWLDMNEPSNFAYGSLTGCENNPLNYPRYPCNIYGSEKNRSIFEKTICMDAVQYAGRHYDVHNLYGTFEGNVTFRALSIIISGQRPFVLSRSTFPGAGRYVAHWLGDNFSAWSQLQASIPAVLEFNTYGLPMVGPDICGFNNNVTEELCFRWMQVGAFYPFCRNHNSFNTIPQDPASLGERVLKVSKFSLAKRYELLPYLYTLFHLAHTQGSTVARPLLHEFPRDENTWGIQYQFLWGPALMISPIVYPDTTTVKAYFPEGIWYDFHTGAVVKEGAKGKTLTLTDDGIINLSVRGGFILPLQKPAVSTTKSRKNGMGLFVAPDSSGNATGLLFWDDGVTHETQDSKKYLLVNFNFQQGTLSSNVEVKGYSDPQSPLNFKYLLICHQTKPKSVTFNNDKLPESEWNYDATTKMLRLNGTLSIPVNNDFKLVISS